MRPFGAVSAFQFIGEGIGPISSLARAVTIDPQSLWPITLVTMSSSMHAYDPPPSSAPLAVKENEIEYGFIGKLQHLKYEYRPDIRDRAGLERNFRE